MPRRFSLIVQFLTNTENPLGEKDHILDTVLKPIQVIPRAGGDPVESVQNFITRFPPARE